MTRDAQSGVLMATATTEVTSGEDGSVLITITTMDWRDIPCMAEALIALAKAHINLHDTYRTIDADDDVGDNWHDMTPVAEYDPDEQGPPHGGNWYDMTPMADHDADAEAAQEVAAEAAR